MARFEQNRDTCHRIEKIYVLSYAWLSAACEKQVDRVMRYPCDFSHCKIVILFIHKYYQIYE
jgi:hypothetical protein